MKREAIKALARDVVEGFEGDEYWIDKDEATEDVAAFACAVMNHALEEVAQAIEALGRDTMVTPYAAAVLIRAMKVKT